MTQANQSFFASAQRKTRRRGARFFSKISGLRDKEAAAFSFLNSRAELTLVWLIFLSPHSPRMQKLKTVAIELTSAFDLEGQLAEKMETEDLNNYEQGSAEHDRDRDPAPTHVDPPAFPTPYLDRSIPGRGTRHRSRIGLLWASLPDRII
jgi:hypothetical protein